MTFPLTSTKKHREVTAAKDAEIAKLKQKVAKLEAALEGDVELTVEETKKLFGDEKWIRDYVREVKRLTGSEPKTVTVEHTRKIVEDNKTWIKKHSDAVEEAAQFKRLSEERQARIGEKEAEISGLRNDLSERETEIDELSDRLVKAEKELSKQSPGNKTEAEKREGLHLVKDDDGNRLLSDKDIEKLTRRGFKYYRGPNLDPDDKGRYEWYVLCEGPETSVKHAALRWLLYDQVWGFTRTAKTSATVNADVEFQTPAGKLIALEVETGSQIQGGKKAVEDKLKKMSKKYDETIIVLTDKSKAHLYKGFGPRVVGRDDVKAILAGIFKSK